MTSQRKLTRRATSRSRRLLCEPLEPRRLLATLPIEDEVLLDFLWPAGGNNARTYDTHPQYVDLAHNPAANIDINQDIERSDLAGGVLDFNKFDEADGGAAVFAAHDGIAIVHELGTADDKIFGHSVEIVAYDRHGYDSANPHANRLYSTFYGHLQETFVVTGERISLGQLIGRVGGSGRGNLREYLPHIHFEFQNAAREAVSVNEPLSLPSPPSQADPVLFYKGMMEPAPSHRLSASTILYGPERQDGKRRALVILAAVRPQQTLPVNMRAFDWAEEVRIRITDSSGSQTFPYRDADGAIRETVRTANESDEDIFEDTAAGSDDIPDLAPRFADAGLYYFQALELNRDVGWGTHTDRRGVTHGDAEPPGEMRTAQFGTWNQRVGWAQFDWASAPEEYPRGPDADAVNLAVVVSPFAPPADVGRVIAADRAVRIPWRILADRTLVITGTESGDEIQLEADDDEWLLTWNAERFRIGVGEFSSVFVDAGEGDDLVSLHDLPAAIGSTVFGRGGDDSLVGGAGTDFLVGGPGDDRLIGAAGEDWILGGEGHDTLAGNFVDSLAADNVDHLFGESGDDELFVDANDDAWGGLGVGWQHPDNRFDVNNDGQVVSLDVLTVINEINAPRYCEPGGRLPGLRPLDASYFDVNGDGMCTPVGDILPLINLLHDQPSAAEGEFAIAAPVGEANLLAEKTARGPGQARHAVRAEFAMADSCRREAPRADSDVMASGIAVVQRVPVADLLRDQAKCLGSVLGENELRGDLSRLSSGLQLAITTAP